jgi:hypothetical protein
VVQYDVADEPIFFIPGVGGGQLPLPIQTRVEVSRDGGRTALVRSDVNQAESRRIRVVMFDSAGDTVYSRALPFEGEAIPSSVRDSVIEAGASTWERFGSEAVAMYRAQVRVPPVYDTVEGVVVGRDGSLLLRLRARDEQRPHLYLDSSGELIGTMVLPSRVEVKEVDSQNVWALESDQYGVQSILSFRIVPN